MSEKEKKKGKVKATNGYYLTTTLWHQQLYDINES